MFRVVIWALMMGVKAAASHGCAKPAEEQSLRKLNASFCCLFAHLLLLSVSAVNTPLSERVGPGEPWGCTTCCATKTGQGNNTGAAWRLQIPLPASPPLASARIKALLSSGEALLSSLPCSLLIFHSAMLSLLTPATVTALGLHVCGRPLEGKEKRARGEKIIMPQIIVLAFWRRKAEGLCLGKQLVICL